MKKRFVLIAAFCLGLALLAQAPAAEASTITVSSTPVEVIYDGTNFCPACVDSQATLLFQLISGGTQLQITLENTGTDGTLTGVGFDTTPDIDFSSAAFSGLSGWKFAKGAGGLGGFEIAVGGSGIIDGLAPGGIGIFTGTLTQPLGSFTLDSTIVHIQGVALAGGGSIKPSGCDASDPGCTSQVPEPASMLLLGTGLLGAGVLTRRRKK